MGRQSRERIGTKPPSKEGSTMIRFVVIFFCILLSACAQNGNDWAREQYGKEADALLKEAKRGVHLSAASETYARRPWILLQVTLGDPDITEIESIDFHPGNAQLPDVPGSIEEIKTLVLLERNYRFLPNPDGKSERAEPDGYRLLLLDRETQTVSSLKIEDDSMTAIRSSLEELASEPLGEESDSPRAGRR